jgi:hypothetical protein
MSGHVNLICAGRASAIFRGALLDISVIPRAFGNKSTQDRDIDHMPVIKNRETNHCLVCLLLAKWATRNSQGVPSLL